MSSSQAETVLTMMSSLVVTLTGIGGGYTVYKTARGYLDTGKLLSKLSTEMHKLTEDTAILQRQLNFLIDQYSARGLDVDVRETTRRREKLISEINHIGGVSHDIHQEVAQHLEKPLFERYMNMFKVCQRIRGHWGVVRNQHTSVKDLSDQSLREALRVSASIRPSESGSPASNTTGLADPSFSPFLPFDGRSAGGTAARLDTTTSYPSAHNDHPVYNLSATPETSSDVFKLFQFTAAPPSDVHDNSILYSLERTVRPSNTPRPSDHAVSHGGEDNGARVPQATENRGGDGRNSLHASDQNFDLTSHRNGAPRPSQHEGLYEGPEANPRVPASQDRSYEASIRTQRSLEETTHLSNSHRDPDEREYARSSRSSARSNRQEEISTHHVYPPRRQDDRHQSRETVESFEFSRSANDEAAQLSREGFQSLAGETRPYGLNDPNDLSWDVQAPYVAPRAFDEYLS